MEAERVLSRKEVALAFLRQRIRSGAFAPGDVVLEVEIAGELGMSVTPVREAFAELLQEGILQGEANMRKRVAELTQRETSELTDLLGILMVAALRRIGPGPSPADQERASSLARKFADAIQAREIDVSSKALVDFAHTSVELAEHKELQIQLDAVIARSVYRLEFYPIDPLIETWATGMHEVAEAIDTAGFGPAAERLEKIFADIRSFLLTERAPEEVVSRPPTTLDRAGITDDGAVPDIAPPKRKLYLRN